MASAPAMVSCAWASLAASPPCWPFWASHNACISAVRLSFPDLIVDILNRLAQLYGTADQQEPEAVGWEEFEATTDAQIETLDEAFFDVAHLIAGLAAADGAVVMSKPNELLGFGGMISGRLPDLERVGRALDLEGEKVVEEGTGNVGARHRSAYRLAGALPGSVVVVISQDGACAGCARKAAASRTGSESEPPLVDRGYREANWAKNSATYGRGRDRQERRGLREGHQVKLDSGASNAHEMSPARIRSK